MSQEEMVIGAKRQPRATRTEMSRRRKLALNKLENGPLSIEQIFSGTDLTYAQAIGILKLMESRGDIYKVGKNGREVLYACSPPQESENLATVHSIRIIDDIHMGETPRVVGMYESDDSLFVDFKLSSGRVLHTQLIAC